MVTNVVLTLHVSKFARNTMGISAGFEALGEIVEFNWKQHINNSGIAGMNRELVSTALDCNPTLVFIEETWRPVIEPETIEEIKEQTGAVVVNWNGDFTSSLLESTLDIAGVVDCTLFSNYRQVDELRARGFNADYLPAGCHPEVYRQVEPDQDYPDVVFLGSGGREFWPNWSLRERMCEAVHKNFDSFAVYGRGWGDGYPFVRDFLGVGEPEARVYSGAKIALGINAVTLRGYTSARLWKAMACGGAMYLCHYFPGVEQWFENGKHLVWWHGIGDLLNKIRYYLNHEEERARIAQYGYEEVRENHSWASRAETLARKLSL